MGEATRVILHNCTHQVAVTVKRAWSQGLDLGLGIAR